MIFIKIRSIFQVILVFLLATNILHARKNMRVSHETKKNNKNNVVCITIPKCGTHLLMKCLKLLDLKNAALKNNHVVRIFQEAPLRERMREAIEINKKMAPNYYKGILHVPSVGGLPQHIINRINSASGRAYVDHWPYTRKSELFFDQHTKANFFVIRDPRDMIISMAFYIHNGLDGLKIGVNDIILDLIDGRKKHFVPWGVGVNLAYPLIYDLGVTEFYKLYLPWMKVEKFYTVKFENLVGAKGGGSDEVQLLEIKNIAKHLDLKLNNNQAKNVIEKLFGKSMTFREGQIGSWKKYFTPEMKAAYKKAPGACELLIALGYEKDSKWTGEGVNTRGIDANTGKIE